MTDTHLTATTRFWVRVTGAGISTDSPAATATVIADIILLAVFTVALRRPVPEVDPSPVSTDHEKDL